MASYTPNLNLILPVGTEKVSRQIVNQNNGIIDSAVGNIVAPTVQGVSTLAELKTYLLAVAGSAEARKNVPVQFNLTAAASPFNSGLYTGIMQKETNGAFSVLCHGYNGGVVEVQYASSTWTIMNLTSEISALNSKTMQANETISDCNNAVNGRAYNFVSGALHRPDFHYGTLFQIGTMLNSSSYKMQIACDVVDNRFAFRKTPNDSWGDEPWNELALNSKIVTKTSNLSSAQVYSTESGQLGISTNGASGYNNFLSMKRQGASGVPILYGSNTDSSSQLFSYQSNTDFYVVINADDTGLGTDLNNYKKSGIYGVEGATNCPTGVPYGTLIVNNYNGSNSYVNQIWQNVLGNDMFFRTCANGTWGPWYKITATEVT